MQPPKGMKQEIFAGRATTGWRAKSHDPTTNLSLTSTELANPSHVLGYICTWQTSQWKCGCRDSACTQSYWQIQSFKR